VRRLRLEDDAKTAIEIEENRGRLEVDSWDTVYARAEQRHAFEADSQGALRRGPSQNAPKGRPTEEGSVRSLAKKMHVDRETLRRDAKALSVAQRFPFMAEGRWKPSQALTAQEIVDRMLERLSAAPSQRGVSAALAATIFEGAYSAAAATCNRALLRAAPQSKAPAPRRT